MSRKQLEPTGSVVREDFLGMGRKPRAMNVLGKRSEPKCKPGNKRCGGACVPAIRNGTKTLCKDEIDLAQRQSPQGRIKQAKELLGGVRKELRERLQSPGARKKAKDDREIEAELRSMKRDMTGKRAQQSRDWRSSGRDQELEAGLHSVSAQRKARRNREYVEAELEFMKRGGYGPGPKSTAGSSSKSAAGGTSPNPGTRQTPPPGATKGASSGGKQQWNPPPPESKLPRNYTPEDDAQLLGLSLEDLKKLDRKALRKVRREMAAKFHPDKGGTQADMSRVNNAFDNISKFFRMDSDTMDLWLQVRSKRKS